jgi:alpha-tubulin suppressor-like RCC1 family protein
MLFGQGCRMSALRVLAATVVLCFASGAATASASVISAGETTTCVAAPAGGPAACWGANSSGSLGDGGVVTHDSYDPVQPIGLAAGVTGVTLTGRGGGSGNHACAIVSGAAKCWGLNGYGELGDGTQTQRNVPTQVVGLESGVTQIDNHSVRTCAIQSGIAKCWGAITKAFSGAADNEYRLVPHAVAGGAGAVDVAPGWRHECIIVANGSVNCYGDNTNDQLGGGSPALPGPASQLVAGLDHNCVVVGSGVRCWGNGTQLGVGSTDDSVTPVTPVGMDSGVTAIDANWTHVCAIKSGEVYCWGDSNNGRLGDGRAIVNSQGPQLTPVKVVNLTNVTAIAVGRSHSCAIVRTAERWCWGSNDHGQLGNEAVGSQSSVPVPVIGASPKPPVVVKPVVVVPPKPKPPVTKPTPKVVAPQILVRNGTRTIGRTRTATIATLVCPAGWAGGSCKVTAGASVSVRIGRKFYSVSVTAPRSVRAGRNATVTVKLSRKAATKLRGKTATVRVMVRLGSTSKRVEQKITAPRSRANGKAKLKQKSKEKGKPQRKRR